MSVSTLGRYSDASG
ncbi:hypothetical protein PENARI_c011G06348 [Penicillium arizonense]|uniref:Uncharacterized protein n=1 Tax=Penicillium arizonense TaxID=1835702 RepID=A0A1F5LG33_PENAI|nr:hypothetical protein PENARI_c011G06348 [Penicillium arizonense]